MFLKGVLPLPRLDAHTSGTMPTSTSSSAVSAKTTFWPCKSSSSMNEHAQKPKETWKQLVKLQKRIEKSELRKDRTRTTTRRTSTQAKAGATQKATQNLTENAKTAANASWKVLVGGAPVGMDYAPTVAQVLPLATFMDAQRRAGASSIKEKNMLSDIASLVWSLI